MAKKTRKTASANYLSQEKFLRAINISFDAGDPDRVAHFFPTAKSVGLIQQLLGAGTSREFLISAPYGSGKSLASTVAIQMVENRKVAQPILNEISDRALGVDPQFQELMTCRLSSGKQGLALALHGYLPSLGDALVRATCDSLKRLGKRAKSYPISSVSEGADFAEVLVAIKDTCRKAKLDRVAIYWDEFGRHLESLVAEGLTADLHDVQVLAEFASRQKKYPFVFSVFLHQGFMAYGQKLPQGARKEWKKIEGRFETVDYVEDSKEIFRLISEIVCSSDSPVKPPAKKLIKSKVRHFKARDQWTGFSLSELEEVLVKAWPLNPVALQLLPKISGRVSQNERTLFTFLYSLEFDREISASDVYDFFSDQMRGDTDAGGTSRQWIETESALSKARSESEERALKTCCLMGLGNSGQRNRVDLEDLIMALASYSGETIAESVVKELISRKLLLHRRHSNEVSVWHGTDMDLRSRLEDNKQRLSSSFNLNDFLAKESRPPVWKPQAYNDEFSIRRYFESVYFRAEDFTDHLNVVRPEVCELDMHNDGRICYLLAETGEEIVKAESAIKDLASSYKGASDRVVFVVPREPLSIRGMALEVASLLEMERDTELTEEDPLVIPEIRQMLDDARGHLQRLIQRLTLPAEGGPKWFFGGAELSVSTTRQLETLLSAISEKVYPLTPIFHNELVVKKKLSRALMNPRKKFLLALLDRCGQPDLGIEGNYPDSAIFRTILLRSGLYVEDQPNHWGFVKPKAIEDEGLSKVWSCIEDFFRDPCPQGRSPQELFDLLQSPPHGVREALLPILFTAGLKAFAYSTSLLHDGEYIADVLPSDIEGLCKKPERYRIKVLALDEEMAAHLEDVRSLFSQQDYLGDEKDLIRNTYEAIQSWLRQLPGAVLETRQLSKTAKDFRNSVVRSKDPVFLLLTRIPEILKEAQNKGQADNLNELKLEIEAVTDNYRQSAILSLRRALQVPSAYNRDTYQCAKEWAESFLPLLDKKHPQGVILKRMVMGYSSDEQLIDSLSDLKHLSPSSVSRWKDEDVDFFAKHLTEAIRQVEDDVFIKGLGSLKGKKGQTDGMKNLIESRILDAVEKLQDVGGKKASRSFIESLLDDGVRSSKTKVK